MTYRNLREGLADLDTLEEAGIAFKPRTVQQIACELAAAEMDKRAIQHCGHCQAPLKPGSVYRQGDLYCTWGCAIKAIHRHTGSTIAELESMVDRVTKVR